MPVLLFGFAVGGAFFLWSEGRAHTSLGTKGGGAGRSRQGGDPVMGRPGQKSEGSARSGESRFFPRATAPLGARLPIGLIAGMSHERKRHGACFSGHDIGSVAPARTSDRHRDRRRLPRAGSVLASSALDRDGRWPMALSKKITDAGKRPLSTRLRKTLRRNWGARVSSACSAHRRGRFAAAAAAPSSRPYGWITPGTTGQRQHQKRMPPR